MKSPLKAAFASLTALLLGLSQPEASADPVYLVELANFACPHCAHMEALDPRVAGAVKATGGVFDFAPVRSEKQNIDPELLYYASRNQGPAVAHVTRVLLFEAMHTDGEPIQSVTQGVVFLQQDWPKQGPAVDFQKMTADSESPAVVRAAERAQVLGLQEGVSRLPAFIFIQQGRPVAMVGRGPQYPSTPQIQGAVLAEIKKLAHPRPPAPRNQTIARTRP